MSRKLWVAYKTPARTFGPTRVSIDGCEYVDDFLKEIKKESQLPIPQNTPITIFQSDGSTEIDVGASPADYLDGNSRQNPLFISVNVEENSQIGNSSENPLIVKTIHGEIVVNPGYVWKVSGIIKNSLSVKGVRSRMYRNADIRLGYYEKDQSAFYYDESGENLIINVLFETKGKALQFESHVLSETITLNSPMNSLKIKTEVTCGPYQLGGRIFTMHYIPEDFESPQETPSILTQTFSIYDESRDEFKYQRIEKLSVFGGKGKAESCHLMSASHCKTFDKTYGEYDKDPNNRLAMSRDLHGWFDGLNSITPLFYLKVVSVSDAHVVEGRYKVELEVVAMDQESANMIFWRLIEGSFATDNPLVMRTFVHVTNPKVFISCLEWKEKKIVKEWDKYLSMESAIP